MIFNVGFIGSRRGIGIVLLLMVAPVLAAVAEFKSIPADAIDDQKIYWGTATRFQKAGSVDYAAVVRATEEYQKARKTESGTAKYWILVNKANEIAIRAISAVGSETEYDLIVAKGYLESLEPPIETEDITALALAKVQK